MARGHLRKLYPGAPIRTLVVDDSAIVRRMISHAFENDSEIQIVGTAPNGSIGLQKADQLTPDAVVLDIEMPDLDGLEVLVRLRRRYPQLVVVMFSSMTERGAAATLKALASGADDYLAKPAGTASLEGSIAKLRTELGARIRQFFEGNRPAAPGAVASARVPQVPARQAPPSRKPVPVELVAIGCSTGGPAAVASVIQALPQTLGVPVVVVQHMPPMFTRLMAERMNDQCSLTVREAWDGTPIRPGEVWIAPGDYHMRLAGAPGSVEIALDQAPQENSCRPSVDVLFRSAADTYGERTLAVILTGMGRDGQRGCAALKAMGARVIAQDEESSVVWGMPGAVVQEGLADWVLPLHAIASRIEQQIADCPG
ncbi:MAG: chemotaxis response regulator protein-glutamate methylesterase [Acidobacteria bacterium]|nr:chemotaxis response regulator protein-glutamate methylesterase [Acidobacteriota bacterium]